MTQRSADHISLRYAALLDAPGTRIVFTQAWNIGGVRLWVDAVQSRTGGLMPLFTVRAMSTLDAGDARLFGDAAREVSAIMRGISVETQHCRNN